jgi:hypothetical protein
MAGINASQTLFFASAIFSVSCCSIIMRTFETDQKQMYKQFRSCVNKTGMNHFFLFFACGVKAILLSFAGIRVKSSLP